MNIVLIGMRGAGKSNISRRLCVLMKRDVVSSDLLIQYENEGKSIPEIVQDNQGNWRIFRDMEYNVVKKIAALDGLIIDCGGGVIVDLDENGNEVFSSRKVDLLREKGIVVWLKGDIARLAQKTKGDATRPTLDESKSAEEIMKRRLPFYEQAADIIIDIEGKNRSELAEIVHKKISKHL
jgi:shikimate kinase